MSHFSWERKNITDINYNCFDEMIRNKKVIGVDEETSNKELYDIFFEGQGFCILRGIFSDKCMSKYNKWCRENMDEILKDKNCNHPIQNDKILFNKVIDRMSKTNPELLMEILDNKDLTRVSDCLLGFAKFGSCTGHWIKPGGKRQETHVDYPVHSHSTDFWKKENKIERIFTEYQVNKILPFFSAQCLIASDYMNYENGVTQIVPYSNLIPNIDVLLKKQKVKDYFEDKFVNIELFKGDVLFFNRRIVHRGGHNQTKYRRNSLIVQYVWSWGVGQEMIDFENVYKNIQNCKRFQEMDNNKKREFLMRFKFHYPTDVSIKT